MGYGPDERGIALSSIGVVATVAGALAGGWITTLIGLGHSLWLFGFLQLFSNIGYFGLSIVDGPSLPIMFAATGFELLTSGLGTGAFAVLLLRLTEKRFSATQYALFSSLFALPRVLAGPITGFAVAAIGWPAFFLATMVVGVPGLVMLSQFVPLGVREPNLELDSAPARRVETRGLLVPGLFAALGLAVTTVLLLAALDAMQRAADEGFQYGPAVGRILSPVDIGDWLRIAGVVTFALVGGMFIAALRSRR